MDIYIVSNHDIHGKTKLDSVFTDRDLAEKRFKYLRDTCEDEGANLQRTRVATAQDQYVPKVEQIS